MVVQESQFGNQNTAEHKAENLEQELLTYIAANQCDANDINTAYTIALSGDVADDERVMALSQEMVSLLDKGLPMNQIGQIIADTKQLEQSQNNYDKIIHQFNFDSESFKVLQQLSQENVEGLLVLRANQSPILELKIIAGVDSKQVVQEIIRKLNDLKKISKQYKFQAEFYDRKES